MRLRGRLAGLTSSVAGLLGMAGAGFAAWVLVALPKPQGFGALLVLAWLMCQIADTAILFAKEPPTPVERSPAPWGQSMWLAFLKDSKFLRLTLAICLISPLVGQLAIFATVFAFRELKFAPQMAAWLTMSTSIARLVLSPGAGWLTDRWGARNSLIFWPALSAATFFPLAIFPGVVTVFAANALAAVAWSGFSGAMNALTCGIPAPENRAGHFTLLGFCMIAVNSVGPVLVGMMFDAVPYRPGFAILGGAALAATAAGFLLLRGISSRAEDFH